MFATVNKAIVVLLLSCCAVESAEMPLPQSCIDLAKREHIDIPRSGQEISLAQARMAQFAAMFPNDFLLNKCRKDVQHMLLKRRE